MPPNFKIKIFVWTLVDSDASPDGVPTHLAFCGTRHFIIYTTSPEKKRWSRLHKIIEENVIVMNPWTRGEIIRA